MKVDGKRVTRVTLGAGGAPPAETDLTQSEAEELAQLESEMMAYPSADMAPGVYNLNQQLVAAYDEARERAKEEKKEGRKSGFGKLYGDIRASELGFPHDDAQGKRPTSMVKLKRNAETGEAEIDESTK